MLNAIFQRSLTGSPADESRSGRLTIDGGRLRLQTLTRLRWVAVAGQSATVFGVHFLLGYEFPVAYCLVVIALSGILNIALQLAYPASQRLPGRFAMLMLGYDIVQLSVLLWLTGGLQNPFALLMVVPVAVSAATQPLVITAWLGALAVLSASLLTQFYWPLPWAHGEKLELPLVYLMGLWTALVSCILFIAVYAWRTGRETRLMSEALAATELVLAREQRLSALDGLAAAAAHKLGTPLSTIIVIAREIERALPENSPMREDAQLLRSQTLRCREILSALTRHSGETDEMFSKMKLSHLLEEVADPYRIMGVTLSIEAGPAPARNGPPAPEPVAPRNPGLLYGLGNLVENAADFAISAVTIAAFWDYDSVSIEIADDGPGFSPGVMSHLGEPYVTTRSSGRDDDASAHGMGLGFFIAKTLLERSGAQVKISNRNSPETGAIVRLRWPRGRLEGLDVAQFLQT